MDIGSGLSKELNKHVTTHLWCKNAVKRLTAKSTHHTHTHREREREREKEKEKEMVVLVVRIKSRSFECHSDDNYVRSCRVWICVRV